LLDKTIATQVPNLVTTYLPMAASIRSDGDWKSQIDRLHVNGISPAVASF
jgi:hypothetical protein